MKIDFNLAHLLGTLYRKGNLVFSSDGSRLLSPVGNRITIFDLTNNTSHTLSFSHRRDIACVAVDPCGNLALSIDEEGKAILFNLPQRLALYHFSFQSAVSCIVFSPTGRHLAAAVGRLVEIWQLSDHNLASGEEGLSFAPFIRYRTYAGHHDRVRHLVWSNDGRFLLSCGDDLTARIWNLHPTAAFSPTVLTGHRESLIAAWFTDDQEQILTLSRDGALFEWSFESGSTQLDRNPPQDSSGSKDRWRISGRHFFHQDHAKANCASYHSKSRLIVVGFSNGVFCLYELPEFVMIHTLSISKSDLNEVVFNHSAEWLAFGSSSLGQLLVWEWQSESYILKQQGHFDSITDVKYSSDGQKIVTTTEDGKVKVWDWQSGLCSVTFSEHSSSVTACQITKKGSLLFTASLDGSVRAWDLIRYRNFRTFAAPTRISFSCLAVDVSNEIVCAGSLDSFDIYVWSVQTGQLLDQLSGHSGPVRTLAFAPSGDQLASGSWDNTVRLWSIFSRSQNSEPLALSANILAVAFRPDSKQIAVSALDGQLSFWSVDEAIQLTGIDGRRDVSGGRRFSDRRSAAHSAETKVFTRIEYSTDGSCLLAGGNSKYICLFDVRSGVILRKIVVSTNTSLEGTQEFLNSRMLRDASTQDPLIGPGSLTDTRSHADSALPGVRRGDASLRTTRASVRITGLAWSPSGDSFCAASTEGVLIFSTDCTVQFDPFDIDIEVTPAAISQAIAAKDYRQSLILAFRLNERHLLRLVYEAMPEKAIAMIVKQVPSVYLSALLTLIVTMAHSNPRLEFNFRWLQSFLKAHGSYLKANQASLSSEMRAVRKTVERCKKELAFMVDENLYTLDYVLSRPLIATHRDTML